MEGKHPATGEYLRIHPQQATELNGVGLATGSASNLLHMEIKCECPGCDVAYRNRGYFAAIEATRGENGQLVPAAAPGHNRLVTTGSSFLFAVSDEVKAQTLGTAQRSELGEARITETYDQRAEANQIGEPMICVCFTCCGKLLHDDPKHYVRGPFRDKDPAEAIAKWGGEILRISRGHAATDIMRGRSPTK